MITRVPVVAALVLMAGCAATKGARSHPVAFPDDVRAALPVYRGADGTPAAWSDLMDAVAGADVVILGEEHDDAVGHRMQLAIVEDVLARWPRSAVSMEMFDRTEQAVVDDYLADFIDFERYARRTETSRWPDWDENYQPIVAAAQDAGAPVIAANTPWLVYTRVARTDGVEALHDVTPAQRALFELPHETYEGLYRERFWEAMAGRAEGEEPEPTDEAPPAHGRLTDEEVLGFYRGQLVMDATMAGSIARTWRAGADKVVHLVGHFHCDFEGGLVRELRVRVPDAAILVISMDSRDDDELHEDDLDRADFVVYTGGRRPLTGAASRPTR